MRAIFQALLIAVFLFVPAAASAETLTYEIYYPNANGPFLGSLLRSIEPCGNYDTWSMNGDFKYSLAGTLTAELSETNFTLSGQLTATSFIDGKDLTLSLDGLFLILDGQYLDGEMDYTLTYGSFTEITSMFHFDAQSGETPRPYNQLFNDNDDFMLLGQNWLKGDEPSYPGIDGAMVINLLGNASQTPEPATIILLGLGGLILLRNRRL